MVDFLFVILYLSIGLSFGGVVWFIFFTISRKAHDQKFIDDASIILKLLNDDPQNEKLADNLIEINRGLMQVYSPPLLMGMKIKNCDPLDAVFGVLMLKDTGELKGLIPVELLRTLRDINKKTFPLSLAESWEVAEFARTYFPDYPDHVTKYSLLRNRLKDWKALLAPIAASSRPTQSVSEGGFSGHESTTQSGNVNQSGVGGLPQWIYPSKLLSTPQSAFNFPEYPGLSVAMRLYIVVGKISWWLAVLSNWGAYILSIILGLGDPEFPLRGVFFGIVLLPLMLLIQLLSNLGLAFVFGSCEIVKVLVRNEENTRTVKKLLEKQIQEEANQS
ncbi:hypothetical protein N9D38_04085 [Rubripirellula sp.]|nr:hypothetical protein [Rubripirellula sp.]